MYENIIYQLKNWMAWDKKSLLYFSIRVPAMVLLPIITAFIPKAMIECISDGSSVYRLALVVAILSVLITMTTWLDPFLNELLLGSARVIRMRYAVMAFKKNINTDYINIESLDGREKNKSAMEFYRSYYSSSSYFITLCSQFLVCVLGVITSLILIYKINIMMLLLILLTCIGEFFLLRYLNEKEKSVKKTLSSIFVKFDYYYELSKDNTAAKDIRLYGFSDYFISAYAKFVYELQKITEKYMHQSLNVSGTRAFLNMIREVVTYVYLVYLVYTNKLNISDFIFYFGIITGFSNWIMSLVICVSDMERCCNDCQAFRDFVEAEDEIDSNKVEYKLSEINSIEFKNVSFKYPVAEESTIKNMSFKVNAGENIAIVGENGVGKTTAVKLLCGLYYPSDGEVLINGISSKDISKSDFFDIFSPVFQDYTFMPMTIAENICVTSDYDKEKLYSAFEKAGIRDKIESLDKKENTFMVKDVYKDATDFSGGEKQKLLLAKAVYKNAPVLVLDEPTAALDPIAENELYLKYNELTKNKISFFISHRLSSTLFCDRIFFISDGKITESGTHEELMNLKGKYYRMYQLQSYYYKEGQVQHDEES